jgi:hypothetical protein
MALPVSAIPEFNLNPVPIKLFTVFVVAQAPVAVLHVLPVPQSVFARQRHVPAAAIAAVGATLHLPLVHWALVVHLPPNGCNTLAGAFTQLPEEHILPVPHWLFAVHGEHAFVTIGAELALVTLQYPFVQSAFVVQLVNVSLVSAPGHLALQLVMQVLHAESLPAGFAMHLHEVQVVPLVQSAFAVHNCLSLARIPVFVFCLTATVFILGSTLFLYSAFAILPKKPAAATIELTIKRAIIIANIILVVFTILLYPRHPGFHICD